MANIPHQDGDKTGGWFIIVCFNHIKPNRFPSPMSQSTKRSTGRCWSLQGLWPRTVLLLQCAVMVVVWHGGLKNMEAIAAKCRTSHRWSMLIHFHTMREYLGMFRWFWPLAISGLEARLEITKPHLNRHIFFRKWRGFAMTQHIIVAYLASVESGDVLPFDLTSFWPLPKTTWRRLKDQLKNVQYVTPSKRAFCAVLTDGSRLDGDAGKVTGHLRNLNWRYLPYIRSIFQA